MERFEEEKIKKTWKKIYPFKNIFQSVLGEKWISLMPTKLI